MDNLSVSEQERQSPEAVSRSESIMFPLDELESEDTWSPVHMELPAAASSGSAGPLVRLYEGLGDSHHCCPESVLVSDVRSGICSLLTLTSGELM